MTHHPLQRSFEDFDEPISVEFRRTLRTKLLADLDRKNTASTPRLDSAANDVEQSQEIIMLKEIDRRDGVQPRTRALIGAAAVGILAVGLGAVLISNHDSDPNGVPGAATRHLRGTFTLVDGGINGSGTTCHGTGPYNDFRPGLDATFRDADGDVVGTGQLRNMTETDVDWLIEDDTHTGFLDNPGFRPILPDGLPSNTTDYGTDVERRARSLLAIDDFSTGMKCTMVFDIEVDPATTYVLEDGSAGSSTYAAADQTYASQQLADVGDFINIVRGS